MMRVQCVYRMRVKCMQDGVRYVTNMDMIRYVSKQQIYDKDQSGNGELK